MGMRNPDHVAQCGGERRITASRRQARHVHAELLEFLAGQPADASLPIFPEVLEDIGELQTLSERRGQGQHLGTLLMHVA